MKKIVFMLISIILLTGCASSKSDNLKAFKDYNSKKESYNLKGTMTIISNEDKFTYDIDVAVKNKEFYKVTLTNTINNHIQVILKNKDGVYVVTPNLNKSFKFQSEWPNNSSQAYLLESLINDVNNDESATITQTKDGYTINSKVNYPNNAKLDNEIISLDKDYNVKKVEVMNVDGDILMSVEVADIDYKPNFSDSYFDLTVDEEPTTQNKENAENKETNAENNNETTTKNTQDCINECTTEDCKNTCKKDTTTSNVLEEIVYPLYVPEDTYLSSKDKVSTENGDRVILTFAGTDPFILVEEVAKKSDDLEIIPVSGEPLMLNSTVGALTSNSIYFTSNGIDYYLTSNSLNSEEMQMVAKSITTGALSVASLK